MSILEATDLSHTFGDKKLLIHTNLFLYGGDKMGLTGLNGAGKSTLINIFSGRVIPDEGMVRWNPKVRVGYLDQQASIEPELTVRTYLRRAFEKLYETDRKLSAVNSEIAVCHDTKRMEQLLERSGEYQNLLETQRFYSVDSEIEKVAAGLGITAFGLETPVGRLSGGQRAKVMLAKLLLEAPDVLLLDEPTNFLDRAHIDWLGKFLVSFKGAFILVSHDFTFLNRVVNCVCDIEFYKITRYNGDYASFQKQKEQKAEEYLRSYQHQQKEISKMEDYIGRNLARASTTAMAQSRRKKLEKMERIEKPQLAAKPSFTFPFQTISPKIMLRIKGLEVGYRQALLPPVNLSVRMGDKLCITGFNGIGKTTLLKTVAGLIPKISGSVRLEDDVKIGFYEQEHVWGQPEKTAFSEIKDAFPTMKDREVRGALAKCGLRAELAMQKLCTLSGGEQAKVKLCKLTLTPCNLLILDEPTNHLDVDAIEQLEEAVKAFAGAVLFVSHSRAFCENITKRQLSLEALFE